MNYIKYLMNPLMNYKAEPLDLDFETTIPSDQCMKKLSIKMDIIKYKEEPLDFDFPTHFNSQKEADDHREELENQLKQLCKELNCILDENWNIWNQEKKLISLKLEKQLEGNYYSGMDQITDGICYMLYMTEYFTILELRNKIISLKNELFCSILKDG